MNPSDPLAQLNPLREPATLGWWPPAPGWWLLLAIIVLGASLGAWLLHRRHRRNAYRRLGLKQLHTISQQYALDDNKSEAITAINALLKSVALRGYPRRDIASISGAAWLEFLQHSASGETGFNLNSLQAQYRRDPGDTDVAALILAARHWISRHEVTQ